MPDETTKPVAAPLEGTPPTSIDYADQLMGVLHDLYGSSFDILGEQAIVHALDSFAAVVSKASREQHEDSETLRYIYGKIEDHYGQAVSIKKVLADLQVAEARISELETELAEIRSKP